MLAAFELLVLRPVGALARFCDWGERHPRLLILSALLPSALLLLIAWAAELWGA